LSPILYGATFFVVGLLTALFFNIASRFTGGLELKVERENGDGWSASDDEASASTGALFGGER